MRGGDKFSAPYFRAKMDEYDQNQMFGIVWILFFC